MLSTLNVHLGSWQRSQKLYFDYDLNFYILLRVTPAFTGAFRFLLLSKFWIFVLLLKVMASGPITSCQIDGETMERVTDFIFLSSKITGDGDCSPEIKRRLLLGRKAMTNLDNMLKSRDITLPTKLSSQSYGFSTSHVWMWEVDHKESRALKNWCSWTVVLEKTLESPSRSNQSILKEISPEHSLEGLLLKLKLQ